MKLMALVAGLVVSMMPHAIQAQGDAAKGEATAQVCVACHNADRLNLAGKESEDLIAAMKGIRKGTVGHPPVLESLSDEDIENIAAYLLSINP